MVRASYGWPSCVARFTARWVPMSSTDFTVVPAGTAAACKRDSETHPVVAAASAMGRDTNRALASFGPPLRRPAGATVTKFRAFALSSHGDGFRGSLQERVSHER